MAKRSNFKRRANDAYDTPNSAISPLINYLEKGSSFLEPCAGKGNIVDYLEDSNFRCVGALDIEPRASGIIESDALDITETGADYIITNPPWTRDILHPMIMHFKNLATTWLLFDADWAHTKQSAEYIKYCDLILPIGRVKWIEESLYSGKDNTCWYRFKQKEVTATTFAWRN